MSTKTKKPSPAERWSNLVSGRLTDKQIFDLFDEFGMAKRLQANGDYDWVRQNLPNIPEEIKKILKIELDKENIARKEESDKRKAEADRKKEEAKPQKQPAAKDGEGGPTQSEWEASGNKGVAPFSGYQGQVASNPASITAAPVTPYKYTTSPNISLVKFTSDPNGTADGDASTIWYVDHSTKTFRPIMSMQSLKDIYSTDEEFQAAVNSINSLSPEELKTGGKLSKFIDLGVDYGIYENKQTKKLEFNPETLENAYGKAKSKDAYTTGMRILNSFMTFLGNNESGIDSTFLNKIKKDPMATALYINALAYGGYSPDDIYKDMKRKQLEAAGDKSMSNISVIDPSVTRSKYLMTDSGKMASSLPSLTPPMKIGTVNREVWSTAAANLSDEYYKLTDPTSYDPGSQSFKDSLDAIQSEFYDHVLQSISAKSEADKAVADTQWKDYTDNLERTYGYRFSDNALTAWNQLQALSKTATEQGLEGSGIEQEQQDKLLQQARVQDSRLREQKSFEEQTAEAKQATSAYSPDQIKTMNEEDAKNGLPRSEWRSVKWGLAPEKAVASSTDFIASFRSKYPKLSTMSDSEIKAKYYDPLYDENGNYRSALYQNKFENTFKTTYGYSPNEAYSFTDPTTGRTVNSLQSYKENVKMGDKLAEEEAFQKTSAKKGDEDYFNPTKGADIIDYGAKDETVKPVTPETIKPVVPETPAKTTSSFVLKAGTEYIPNEQSIKNYSNIYKDTTPGSTKLYGTKKTQPAGMPAMPNKPSAFTPKTGTEYIPNEQSMKNYSNIYKDTTPGSKKLYGTKIK